MKRIAYDVELKKPGCVLIQAAMGAFQTEQDRTDFLRAFPSETWVTYISSNMRVYLLDDQVTLEYLAAFTQQHSILK